MAILNRRMTRQAIETKYIGPSNVRGARIKASAQAGSVYVPYDHSLNTDDNHAKAAQALADKWGWEGDMVQGGSPSGKGDVFVFVETH
jgi:hypothetical protein